MVQGKKHVALVGFMAAGKTTTGRRLARMLGWPFCDTDSEIARVHGAIAEIFEREGEDAFRRYEREAIEVALASDVRCVIAVGGGAVSYEPTRALLAGRAYRVFLHVTAGQIVRRLRRSANVRPLIGTEPDEDDVERLYRRRMPAYREAEIVVDCVGMDASGLARLIERRLREAGVVS